jgi:hypothetical protein
LEQPVTSALIFPEELCQTRVSNDAYQQAGHKLGSTNHADFRDTLAFDAADYNALNKYSLAQEEKNDGGKYQDH